MSYSPGDAYRVVRTPCHLSGYASSKRGEVSFWRRDLRQGEVIRVLHDINGTLIWEADSLADPCCDASRTIRGALFSEVDLTEAGAWLPKEGYLKPVDMVDVPTQLCDNANKSSTWERN